MFVVSPILMMLHRNNGFHVAILTAPFLIWYCKGLLRRRMIIFAVGIVAFNTLWEAFIFDICGVTRYSDKEKYSLISQQLSRIAKTEAITQEDKVNIAKYITCPVEQFGEVYLPEVSDPTKGLLKMSAINDDHIGFIGLSLKMIIKYPKSSLEGFLNTTYSYWHIQYIETIGGGGSLNTFPQRNTLIDKFSQKQLFYNPITNTAENIMANRNIPIINIVFRNGFVIWVMLFCFGYCWYRKKYRLMLLYAPLFAIWLICIASPCNSYRYIYGIVTTLPVLISTLFIKCQNSDSLSFTTLH